MADVTNFLVIELSPDLVCFLRFLLFGHTGEVDASAHVHKVDLSLLLCQSGMAALACDIGPQQLPVVTKQTSFSVWKVVN